MPKQAQNQSGGLSNGNEQKDRDHDLVLKAWQRAREIYGYSKRKAKPILDVKNERKEYEKKYLARYKGPKTKPKKLSNLKHVGDLGGINVRKHFGPKRREYLAKRKEYEKKYLARYKGSKTKPKKLSNLKYDGDLGGIHLRKHFVNKRREYLANRKEYEQKYIVQYMKNQRAKSMKSSSKKLDHDLISGRLNLRAQIEEKRKELQKERKSYETNYLSRYKQPKATLRKSKPSTPSDDELGKFTFQKHFGPKREKHRAELRDYEKDYLARYAKAQKAKRTNKK